MWSFITTGFVICWTAVVYLGTVVVVVVGTLLASGAALGGGGSLGGRREMGRWVVVLV